MDAKSKTCSKCGEEKLLEEFRIRKDCSSGMSRQCKSCSQRVQKQYRQANKEKIAEQDKQYRNSSAGKEKAKQYSEANKEKLAATSKQYRQANKEKIAAHFKQYYQKNRKKIIERSKRSQQDNKEKRAAYLKQYQQDNKEKLTEYHRQYLQANIAQYTGGLFCFSDILSKPIKRKKNNTTKTTKSIAQDINYLAAYDTH